MTGFAVDIGAEGSAYVQGVAAPSSTGIDVLTAGLSLFEKKPETRMTDSAIQRKAFGALSEGVASLKGSNPLQVRSQLSSLISEYNAQGFDIGEAEASMIKMQTGVDVDYLTVDTQQEELNASVQFLQENPSFVFDARRKLEESGKDFTEEDVLVTAIQSSQRHQANLAYLSSSTTVDRVEFRKTWVPTANAVLDTIVDEANLLFDVEKAGRDASPEDIMALSTDWADFKVQFARPEGITNEDWKSFESKIKAVDDLITQLKSYDQDQLNILTQDQTEYMTKIQLNLVDQLTEEDPLAGLALYKNPEFFNQQYMENNYGDIYTFLTSEEVREGFTKDARGTLPDETTTTTTEAGVPETPVEENLSVFEPDFIDTVSEKSPTEKMDLYYDVVHNRVNLSTVASMNDPTHRDNFLMGLSQAAGVLSQQGRVIAQDNLNLLFSDETFKKIEAVRKLDPEAADLAVEQLKQALFTQWNTTRQGVAGSLSNSPFKIVGMGEIEYDLDKKFSKDGLFSYTDKALDLVKIAAAKYYGGDVTRMIIERGRRLDSMDRSAIETEGFKFSNAYQEYRRVLRVAEQGKFLVDYAKKLGLSSEALEQSMIQPMDEGRTASGRIDPEADYGTQNNPFPIAWSDDTDTDEKLFESLADGQYFIGPDGNTYIKGQQ